jgi:hypothetical protein
MSKKKKKEKEHGIGAYMNYGNHFITQILLEVIIPNKWLKVLPATQHSN